MPDSGTNSCSWSEVTEDSHPLDVELPFPVIGAPVASQNAVSSHMDQNRPSVDSYAARVRHNLPEDVEPVLLLLLLLLLLFVDVPIICLPLSESISTCTM